MKKIITILCIAISVIGCKSEGTPEDTLREGYLITGEAPGVYNGIRVYLQSLNENGRKTTKDTAIVMNERFTFEGKVDAPKLWLVSMNSAPGNLNLIVENKEMFLKLDKDDLAKSTISGTKANEELMAYGEKVRAMGEKRRDLGQKIRATSSQDEKESLNKEFMKLNQEFSDLPLTYISEHPKSLYSLVLMEALLKGRDLDLQKLSSLYEGLDASNKNSDFGKRVNSILESKKMEQALTMATAIGSPAPDFTAPTPDGTPLNLKNNLGKVTIVDFWAAWCGPCRRENPNVVNVYNKYHDKGLEIIGVSLDGTSRQTDPKAAWLEAIEKDKLTWNHVSNLKYFSDPVARAYNIRSIPATFILDENGIIVAKNLRGIALESKIAELLN